MALLPGRRGRPDRLFPARARGRLGQATIGVSVRENMLMAASIRAERREVAADEERVLELIGAINREGVTVFTVEQNASLALQSGRIALSGTASRLLRAPRIRGACLGGAQVA